MFRWGFFLIFFNVYNGISSFPFPFLFFFFFFFFFVVWSATVPYRSLTVLTHVAMKKKKFFFFETSLWFHSQWKLKQKFIFTPLTTCYFFLYIFFISKNRIKLKYDGKSKINKFLAENIWENNKHQQDFISHFFQVPRPSSLSFFLILMLFFFLKWVKESLH